MENEEIIGKILDSYLLRTFMVPDPVLPQSAPQHAETLDLPHVVINGQDFWAKSETRHLYIADDTPYTNVSFCYTRAGDIFCSYGAGMESGLSAMPKSHYKVHEWRLHRKHRLIWRSDEATPASVIGDEIEQGSKFTIAMLDVEDIWNVHPVDLPMYFTATNTFELKTANDHYPQGFREPNAFRDRIPEDEAVKGLCSEGKAAVSTTPGFSTFYNLASDRTYASYYDISRASRHQYKRLMVFSDSV